MSWSGITRTNHGRRLYAGCIVSGTFRITKVILGDGNYHGSFADIENVVSPRVVFTGDDMRVIRSENKTIVEITISSAKISTGFYFRELAVEATDGTESVLYAYDNCGSDAEYISAETDGYAFDDRVRIDLITADAASINVEYPESTYVASNGGNTSLTIVQFEEPEDDTSIDSLYSGIKLGDALGVVKKLLRTPPNHASRHASDGADPITPASIGAAAAGHTHEAMAKLYSYTATLLSADWTGEAAPYSQTVVVAGVLATDRPIVDITQTGAETTDKPMREAWANITRVTTAAGSITAYADSKPGVDLPLQMEVLR